MKKTLFLLLVSFVSLPLLSQTEHFLGNPYHRDGIEIIPKGVNILTIDHLNEIWYGKTRPKRSLVEKPVLVFVHGFGANFECYTKGNGNMYSDAYNSGYKSAYVSLTPNKSIWRNGYLLSKMLKKITEHYGVSKVVLVGWSKGGVDIDAAVSFYGAQNMVHSVITLGSPHWGTWMAEAAHLWWMYPINLIAKNNNPATRTIQRGYMSWFRHVQKKYGSKNSIKWYTVGGWGNGVLGRMTATRAILYAKGGSKSSGGNDGVVPYMSSKRPGSRELYGGQYWKRTFWRFGYWTGPGQTDMGHLEMTSGKRMWSTVSNIARNIRIGSARKSLNKSEEVGIDTAIPANTTSDDYFPNSEVSSNTNFIIGTGQELSFPIEQADSLNIRIIRNAKSLNTFQLKSPSKKIITKKSTSYHSKNAGTKIETSENFYTIKNPKSGIYSINPPKNSIVIIETKGGEEVILNTGLSHNKMVYKVGQKPTVSLNTLNGSSDLEITGTIVRTNSFDGKSVENLQPIPVRFKLENGQYRLQTEAFAKSGSYEILLKVTDASFEKTIQAILPVIDKNLDLKQLLAFNGDGFEETTNIEEDLVLKAYPIPFDDKISFTILKPEELTSDIIVYDTFGRLVATIPANLQQTNITYTFEKSIASGVFIFYYNTTKGKKSFIAIKK